MEMATTEQTATLKILLGIADESKDVILAFVIDKATRDFVTASIL